MSACPECQGCGEIYRVNPARHVTDPDYVTDVLACALCAGTGRIDVRSAA